MLSTRIAAWFVFLLTFASTSFAPAQGGYTKEKYPQHGLKFQLARDYKWLALQPSEEWVVLQWTNSKSAKNAMLRVVRIDYKSDPGPVTPGGRPLDPDNPAEPTPKGEKDKEEKKKPLTINSWERYVAQKHPGWRVNEVEKGKPRDEYEATEYTLRMAKSTKTRGWAYVWKKHNERTFAVIGWAYTPDFEAQRKIWRKIATGMRFDEPIEDPEIAKLRKYYERRPKFKDPEYRIRVRTALDGNWKSEDTENYLVIYNTKDQPLVRRIVKDMESIRKEYVKLFPSVEEINAVSTVRVCKDKAEYVKYGGPARSAGYWSWVTEELVFYDATVREKGKKTEKQDTFIVLYHEAFHQYIHYSAGRLAPHSWFNEGYGDYFSGAQVRGGKVKRVGANTWRLRTIQEMLKRHDYIPWPEMIEYTKAAYYSPRRQGLNYAQGWSMVYFLNASKVAQRHKQWSKILPTYFEELKVAWAEEQAGLDPDEEDEEAAAKARSIAVENAKKRAVDLAFKDVDLNELEGEWIKFTLAIRSK